MKRLFLAGLALLALAGHAPAADLPIYTKAPPQVAICATT
jgi:hypothetical protein